MDEVIRYDPMMRRLVDLLRSHMDVKTYEAEARYNQLSTKRREPRRRSVQPDISHINEILGRMDCHLH